ncbi:MAG: hypothetical protein FWH20_09655 [Oscillospiraceae bacterium]|nr:hypothetical protein [Oscillospiraceae bacterium]
MIDINKITDYLSERVSDPVPTYILVREIYKESPTSPRYASAYGAVKQSKWYRGLVGEQWADGSWGRFHSQDSKAVKKQKYATTEAALRRARELSLAKDDPAIAKCIAKMERYVREEETWPDSVEKHKDNGKSHMFCRPFLTAANIHIFDPENPVIQPLRDVVVRNLTAAFAGGSFDKEFWGRQCREYVVSDITAPGTLYNSMLLQGANIDDDLQRQLLNYIWGISNGIYYVSSVPPAEKQNLEDKRFDEWLRTLELLSGFSLFHEFAREDVRGHLLCEVERLINDDNNNIACNFTCRYSENWRDKSKSKFDLVLRILRLLMKS